MDLIAVSVGSGLTGAFIFWLGIILFEQGLRRFGVQARLSYSKVFLSLFITCFVLSLLLKGGQKLGFVGGLVLFAGAIVWISSFISVFFRRK